MAVTGYQRVRNATKKSIKSVGGDAAITLASLANGSARQAAKLDLGATRAEKWRIRAAFEFAAAGLVAGNTVDIYAGYSDNGSPTSDNPANLSGSDAAYTGYSSNKDDALAQLEQIASFPVTTDATPTLQVADLGIFEPDDRYVLLVIDNQSGAAFHSSDANMFLELIPIEGVQEDS